MDQFGDIKEFNSESYSEYCEYEEIDPDDLIDEDEEPISSELKIVVSNEMVAAFHILRKAGLFDNDVWNTFIGKW